MEADLQRSLLLSDIWGTQSSKGKNSNLSGCYAASDGNYWRFVQQ